MPCLTWTLATKNGIPSRLRTTCGSVCNAYSQGQSESWNRNADGNFRLVGSPAIVPQMLHAGYERAPLPEARQESHSEAPTDASTEPPAKAEGKPAGKGKARDPFLDNAKYLTIVLVGIGHAWDPIRSDSRTAEALYYVL